MATNDPDDETSIESDEEPLDPPTGASDDRVRQAIEAEQQQPAPILSASQDGTDLVIHEAGQHDEANGAWLSVDIQTVDPRLVEVLQ